jgi:hypothetical protein
MRKKTVVEEEKDRGREQVVPKQENEELQGIDRREGLGSDESGGMYAERGLDFLWRFFGGGFAGYLGKIAVAAILTGLAVLSMTR